MKTKKLDDMVIDINMEIRFGERVGHGGWLIGPNLFRPKACPAFACSSFASFFLYTQDEKR